LSTVLVVEDDRDIREALGAVLEIEGYRVLYARDGREALAEARREHPDLILLDLMMPKMNGWQFRETQREDASISAIPVVVCSAATNVLSIGAAGYLPKPCDVQDVIDAVARHSA
jgi:two-component system response regulator MprA